MSPLIDIRGIAVTIGARRLIHDVDLSVSPGEIVTVIGPNGAGKTTLLRAVMGLQKISGGTITRQKGLRIGYVPQRFAMAASLPLTVERLLRLTPGVNADDALDALHEVGAAALGTAQALDLSGGETQRVLLARALLRRPDLLVLDEPTQGVDFAGEQALYQLIATLRDRLGCGVLMVSHDLHVVMGATDHVVCLNHHVCCTGHPSEVSTHESYLDLFGRDAGRTLAVYHHRHDHEHGLDGETVAPHDHGDGDTVAPHDHGDGDTVAPHDHGDGVTVAPHDHGDSR